MTPVDGRSSGRAPIPTLKAMMRGFHDQRDFELVEALLKALRLDEPTVRVDLVEAARGRLVVGPRPSAFDLAGTVVAEFA